MNEKLRRDLEEKFNLKVVGEQIFPWGESYWLQLDPSSANSQRTVSIVTVHPDKIQKTHTHAGYEEIIFGLEGKSIHWSNDRQIEIGEGQLGYIPGGGRHSMINSTDKDCRFLSIVYPTIPQALGSVSPIEEINLQEISKTISLDTIAEKFSLSVGLAVTLVDSGGTLLTETRNLPEFCKLCMQQGCGDCLISPSGRGHGGNDLRESRCRFGIYTMQSPIIINKRILGYLGCGYVRIFLPTTADELIVSESFSPDLRKLAHQAYINLDLANRNHLQSVAETLSLVSVSLVQLMIDSVLEKQINTYKLNLSTEKQRKAELENSLNEAKLKFIESQVNPHFLFNTLNTIAQTSVMEGADTAASLTYALSNLLRCSLGKTDSLITLKDELSYIKDYLVIQTTRFPDKFKIMINVSEDILNVKVPFMTLMTLVENSFRHGFSGIRWQGILEIKGSLENGQAVIQVMDNGIGMPDEMLNNIPSVESGWNFHQSSSKGIGLRNVYKRLEYYFGVNFTFNIQSSHENGTKVTIMLPADKE